MNASRVKSMGIAYAVVALFSGPSWPAGEDEQVAAPLGLPQLVTPESNPATPTGIELGRRLFFDERLSGSGRISCATCHVPEKAYSDGKVVAEGIYGRQGTRNTPSIVNAGYYATQFWDGRRVTLEDQVLDPLFNPNEHGLKDKDDLLTRIRRDSGYPMMFKQAYGTEIGMIQVSQALAAFVRSLVAADSPVDRYLYGADKAALSREQVRGLELFRGAAQCATCHPIGERTALLTDNAFHNMAVGLDRLLPKTAALARQAAGASPSELNRLILSDPDAAAAGRFIVTRDPQDIGKFKTPSLRNVELTAPYMHDGSIATLEDAVNHEIYYRGKAIGRPLILTPTERGELVAFLKGLTSPSMPH